MPTFLPPSRRDQAGADGSGGYTDGAYLIRRAMGIALSDAARSLAEKLGRSPAPSREIILLDIGGRGRPYADLFSSGLSSSGYRVHHLVVDPDASADVMGTAEHLPVSSGCADLVLCTQVLEHVANPERAVSEMARALKPHGTCLLTTHGTWFYHPDPEDYWRWTPAGLADLFSRGGFTDVQVSSVGGTKLALAVLALTAFERASGDGAAGAIIRKLVVAPANFVASRWLLGRVAGRTSLPGDLVINYVVTARPAPRKDRA